MSSTTDWEEIKRLAADFQRAQLTSSLQKLSERNCVEIVNKLVEQKLVELYITSSGKEYVTPTQIYQEIRDELIVHQGRIELSELCSILNVSFNVVERRAADIVQNDSKIYFLLGQLISEEYLDAMAEEVNERLQQNGSITIGDIAKSYDLPGEFLFQAVSKRLGTILRGNYDESDPETIFTEAYVARHRYQIRGILTAITHPTVVSNIITRCGFQERLFFSIAEKFISSGVVSGSFSGPRLASQAVFVPTIYSKAQFDWVDNFLKQNGYLEFEALTRLGISDPQSYIKRHFKDRNLTFVPGACVGQLFIDQIDATLDEALANGGYVDVYPFLPSTFSGDVCTDLINLALKSREASAKASGCSKSSSSCVLFCDSIVVSERLLLKVSQRLEQLMPSRAQQLIAKGAFKHQLSSKARKDDDFPKDRKEERRKKAAGGKAGGGTQGRETKTKSTKNKKGRRDAHHSDDEDDRQASSESKVGEFEFMSLEEMQTEIERESKLEDCPEELLEQIATYLHESMTRKFQEVARAAFLATLCGGGDTRKKTHQQLQEKVVALLTTVRLAEKGMKEFSEDIQAQLCKYLLRTQCSEIVNEVLLYLADDHQIDLKNNKELSIELRLKIINQLDDDMKKPLLDVHKTLTGTSVEQFLAKVDNAVAAADIIIKKKDNKRDKQVLLNHRSDLVDQLNVSLNAAVSLHLASLILFQVVTGNMLIASGKFVPQILSFLQPNLPDDFYKILQEYQSLVMRSFALTEDQSVGSVINSRLEELTPKLKEISVTFKKAQKERQNSVSKD